MWTVVLFLNLLALHCTVSSSPPSPINVIFTSVNLRNMLQWLPGNDTPNDTHYTVQYAIYGDSVEGSKGRRVQWRPVRRCTEIVRSWCDLSNETWDLEHGYYARVRAVSRRASSKWALTGRRFDPKTDTSFGPPLVSVELEENNAIITLKGPMRYLPNNHTKAVSMATVYPQMIYNLSIYNTGQGQTHHFPVVSSSYKYRLMDYNTKYCFSAKTRFVSMPAICQPSGWQCIMTPEDPLIGQLRWVIVGIVVPAVCICVLVVVGYLLYRYLSGKGQKSPYILDPPAFHPPPLTFPPEKPNLILITIIKELPPESSISVPACAKRPRHCALPPPGYASQRPETPPAPEEPWDNLSIDYGFVGVGPKMEISRENGNNLKGEHKKCTAGENSEKKDWEVEDSLFPGHTQTETSTLLQAHAWSQPVLPPLLSFQGAPPLEVNGEEEEEREFTGLFLNTTPQTGLFCIPLNLQTNEEGVEEEMDAEVRVRTDGEIDGGVEERNGSEALPLLSAYACQNITNMASSYAGQSASFPDDYGAVKLATAQEIEQDDNEEEEGPICVDWDPQTGKLVLPEMAFEYSKRDGLDRLMQAEKGRENGMEGDEEEVNSMKGKLRLENVFVRQGSEEKAEAERAKEIGGGTGLEADDLFTRWNLVISMDE